MDLFHRAGELAQQGYDVIGLEVGEPDFNTPEPVVEAAQRALRDGDTRYTQARGLLPLRERISGFYAERYGVEIAPDRIFITAGASGGLLLLTALLMNAGDNLLMADPCYPCNRHILTAFDAEGLLIPVTAAQNYQLTPGLVESWWNFICSRLCS